ncbi:CRISPR-associated protein [Candidatus Vecturithrix granuli]|uniref:CRISPR-associated protein n=1 Tax=Vecturithrix granuli TaxID=1499967 RepID=A0A081CAL6_VECG1|nr:CRISPR-associated protein [Candidatus Vecturithrix granuli]
MLMTGYPTQEIPAGYVQGPALQGMFLHLLESVDPAVMQRLHADNRYRPYTLSPLGVEDLPVSGPSRERNFQGFRLSRQEMLQPGQPCSVRITLLEDDLFPTFSRYFLAQAEPTFRLGNVEFQVTNVLVAGDNGNPWSRYISYPELIAHAARQQRQCRIGLRFLSPTSFRNGDVDLPLPWPRLVFQSYLKRFCEFYPVDFLPDFAEQVECYTGIGRLDWIRTETIKTKNVLLVGFTGDVWFHIDPKAPPDLVWQMNLLADFALFCGTGRKTTIGLGQTMRM